MRGQLTYAIALITILFSIGCNTPQATNPLSDSLEDLQDIGELRTLFNQDEEAIRLVLLLSPT